jgi:hypothetical protein
MLRFLFLGPSRITSVKKMKICSMNHDWTSDEMEQVFKKYPKLENLRMYIQYKDAEQMRDMFEQVKLNGTMLKRLSIGLSVPVDPKVIPVDKRNGTPEECDGIGRDLSSTEIIPCLRYIYLDSS